jgi:hypothetical protein
MLLSAPGEVLLTITKSIPPPSFESGVLFSGQAPRHAYLSTRSFMGILSSVSALATRPHHRIRWLMQFSQNEPSNLDISTEVCPISTLLSSLLNQSPDRVADTRRDGWRESYGSNALPFLPNLQHIYFPPGVEVDLNFLRAINSHLRLRVAQWRAIPNFSLPHPSSLLPGALSFPKKISLARAHFGGKFCFRLVSEPPPWAIRRPLESSL